RRHDLVEVGAGTDVHPEDPLEVAEGDGEAGVGAARSVGGDDEVDARVLGQKLATALDVAQGANRRGATDGHGVGPPPVGDQAGARLGDGRLDLVVVEVAGPYDLGAEQLVEQDVAARVCGPIATHDDRARQAELV